MKRAIQWFRLGAILFWAGFTAGAAEDTLDSRCPVRAFCIAAPAAPRVEEFIRFMEQELAPRSVNTLILRVDYGFQFSSRPEMADPNGLSPIQARQLSAAGRRLGIRVIPQINLLGHQSWQSNLGKLLRVYPQFDETPQVKLPDKYVWPNPDRLYCKSYCPRHPDVHEVVFALVDEVCGAFECDAFHAGLDEVFYLGEEQCPRCRGQNKAELFAGEVRTLRDHLHQSGRQLWMWGDRLLDGRTTGIGEWEASQNDTSAAVDLIPKDVLICDWHYERADPTPVYFATKGFDVVSCAWRNPQVGGAQVRDLVRFREVSTPQMRSRFRGVMQTVWSGSEAFLNQFTNRVSTAGTVETTKGETACFLRMFEEVARLK